MVTDPISDLLVRLRNGFRRHHDVVTIPASKLKHEVLRVLQAEGYHSGHRSGDRRWASCAESAIAICGRGGTDDHGHATRKQARATRVRRARERFRACANGIGMAILSTSKGIMTDQASRKAGLGGEVLCRSLEQEGRGSHVTHWK